MNRKQTSFNDKKKERDDIHSWLCYFIDTFFSFVLLTNYIISHVTITNNTNAYFTCLNKQTSLLNVKRNIVFWWRSKMIVYHMGNGMQSFILYIFTFILRSRFRDFISSSQIDQSFFLHFSIATLTLMSIQSARYTFPLQFSILKKKKYNVDRFIPKYAYIHGNGIHLSLFHFTQSIGYEMQMYSKLND